LVFRQVCPMLKAQGLERGEKGPNVLAVVTQSGDRQSPQNLTVVNGRSTVRPRTDGQARYVHAMKENDVVFCIGPAGTGKTYLAVGMAVHQLRQGMAKKIVLVRPAVEA